MESFHWSMTIGTSPGYSTKRGAPPDLDTIGTRYQEIAAAIEDETGVYISAVLTPSRALYRTDWGCPAGGEETVTFSGSHHPAFSKAPEYKAALQELAARMKDAFRQSTILLEVWPDEITYLSDKPNGR